MAEEAPKKLRILGTRGIPAQHGGFETFAERLALHLAARSWEVTVYCQTAGDGPMREHEWMGVRLIDCPVRREGALGTMIFDWRTTRHAAATGDLALTLGYNTAAFCLRYRLRRVPNLINMDGIEWRRAKWSPAAKLWLYLNERLASAFCDHLIADHPGIQRHLERHTPTERITMIPYGADRVEDVDPAPVESLGMRPGDYALVVARPEPENSILEIVAAWSREARGRKLVMVGGYEPGSNAYHAAVMRAASDEVAFPGAIYDPPVVQALRRHALVYVHGHQVGGTNPSLVEALGAGSPVLAHDNPFNRWVAGEGAAYFSTEEECARRFEALLDDARRLAQMSEASTQRFMAQFTWERVLQAYETLLAAWACGNPEQPQSRTGEGA